MSSSISETILRFIRNAPIAEFDDGTFNDLALRLFRHQIEKNTIYRGVCEQQNVVPNRVASWREIPAVTTSAFKEVPLTCFPPHEAVAVFHTSGTTQKRSGKHYFRTLNFYRTAMLRSFAAYCLPDQLTNHALRITHHASRMLFLGPTAEHFPNSSLGYMFSGIRDEFGDEQSAVFFSPDGVEVDGFRAALEKALEENAPVFILGTALALWECMEKFAQQGRKFQLPPGSRMLDTGGYKGRQIEMSREEFQRRLSETFGVPPEYLLNEYGMTELSSQFYASRLPGVASGGGQIHGAERPLPSALRPLHFPPPWVRVVAVDPETLNVLPAGEVGLLRIFDLANVDSVLAIQTEDLGRAWQDRIELVGRATGAELRGCSLLTEAIVRN